MSCLDATMPASSAMADGDNPPRAEWTFTPDALRVRHVASLKHRAGQAHVAAQFVHVFPNVLAAVVDVEVALPIGHKPHEQGSGFEGLQGSNVNAGTPSAEVVKVVRGEQF